MGHGFHIYVKLQEGVFPIQWIITKIPWTPIQRPKKKKQWTPQRWLPSGKLSHNYGKSPFLMGNLTISMVIFHSYVKLPEGRWLLDDYQDIIMDIIGWLLGYWWMGSENGVHCTPLAGFKIPFSIAFCRFTRPAIHSNFPHPWRQNHRPPDFGPLFLGPGSPAFRDVPGVPDLAGTTMCQGMWGDDIMGLSHCKCVVLCVCIYINIYIYSTHIYIYIHIHIYIQCIYIYNQYRICIW